MIPRRIVLAGFLSYRDEQEFDFDGAPICMLTGPNGSGKSSVFDAVTFALYGAHRGGKQSADELITKGRDGLRVEFDFEVAGALYRVHRTARRKGGPTRQVFRAEPGGGWQSIPDTHLEAGFDAWVREHLGLTFEAFTSSVLLLQGRAEKLVSARPAERLVILKEIVGLDRFERLHLRVADRARLAATRAEDLRARLQGIPTVADDDLARAGAALAAAEAAHGAAVAAVDRLIGLEHPARDAEALRAEADDLRGWFERAAQALAEADAIDRGLARLAELRESLPHLETAIARRRALAEADAATRAQEEQARLLEADAASAAEAQRARCAALDALQGAIPAAERALDALGEQLAEAARLADRARRRDRRAAEVARFADQLAGYPADGEAQVAGAAVEVERLDAADRALPALTRLARDRAALRAAAREAGSTRTARADAEADVVRSRAEADAEAARLAEADAAHRRAEADAQAARIARANAVRLREALDGLAGQAACDRCGQALTPAHLDDERRHRDAEVAAAADRHRAAATVADAAGRALETTRDALDATRGRLAGAADRVTALTHDLDRLGRDVARLTADCASAVAELPDPFRRLVLPSSPSLPASFVGSAVRTATAAVRTADPTDSARHIPHSALAPDWTATTYPAPSDLVALRREASALRESRKRLDEARDLLRRRSALVERLDDARRALAEEAAGLPDDPAAPARDHDRLAAEVKEARARLDALRAEARQAGADLEKLRQAEAARHQEIAALARSIAAAAGRREGIVDAIDRARRALPEPWRSLADSATEAEAAIFRRELRQLEAGGIEARAGRLQEARTQADARRARLDDLGRRLDALPEEARRPPAEILRLLEDARADRERLDRARIEAAGALDQLRQHRADRGTLDAEALAADRACATAGRLAELLGPRHLQRHLVREAEEGILRFADDLLDRLSGGQLTLRLRKSEDPEARIDRALDLEVYNRETKQAISVPFLSGSQRFRVAVALALGIGRYAGRLHRPIESVIIDEGFGCLDREGRQVMIREIQNLREHVRRIILVSHQEEFAGAFADGYHLEIRDGTTVATRFSL